MLPSYRRVNLLSRFMQSAIDTADNPDRIFFTVCANERDEETINFLKDKTNTSTVIENTGNPNLSFYFNEIFNDPTFSDPAYIVSMLGDDMVFESKGWDTLIIDEINSFNGIGIWYGDDCCGTGERMAVQLFMSRKYAEAVKPLPYMCPLFKVNDIDAVWFNTAKMLGHAHYLHNLKIRHNHTNTDETSTRLISLYRECEEAREGAERGNRKYELECVENIRRNLLEELNPDLGIMMTTYNRIDLLKRTIASYNASESKPDAIHVWDDKSTENVTDIIQNLAGVIYHKSTFRVGVYSNTPISLQMMFDTLGYKAILILDSDTLFDKHWWLRTIAAYNMFKGDDKALSVSLFNYNGCETLPSYHPSYHKRKVNGAFGCIIKKEYFNKYIRPMGNAPTQHTNWDNHAAEASTRDGYSHYSTSRSYLQHIGTYEGEHTGVTETGIYATDFHSDTMPDASAAIDQSVSEKRILACCLARIGDCINASLIVNYLKSTGKYHVDFITLPMYAELCQCIMPDTNIITIREPIDCEWAHLDTGEMKKRYGGYRYYLNLQPGSPEHHSSLIGCGKSIHQYTTDYARSVLQSDIPSNCYQYRMIAPRKVEIEATEKICWLSCDTASPIKKAFDDKKARIRARELNDAGWYARILKKDKPEGSFREVRSLYYWGRKIWEMPYLMQHADLFIGNDSGLAWCSIFSNGKKEIHHCAERIAETNNRFSLFDNSFVDIIE